MKLYFDTSALIKLYYPEPETELIADWIIETKPVIFFTLFHELELKNAIGLKAFRGEITEKQLKDIIGTVNHDLDTGVLTVPLIHWNDLLCSAVALSDTFVKEIGTRTLDIIHVAAALYLQSTHFLTFDKKQAKLADAQGLINPDLTLVTT